MKLNLKNPVVFFDLETTGTNINTDRIVEICYLKVYPNGNAVVTAVINKRAGGMAKRKRRGKNHAHQPGNAYTRTVIRHSRHL